MEQFARTVKLDRSDVLWVIIPCRNEEKHIESCLDSFKNQVNKEFQLVIVDNGSTDATYTKIREWELCNPRMWITVLREPKAGTAYACQKGCLYAIRKGATMLARTDGDSRVDPFWVSEIKNTLVSGADFLGGKLEVLQDEQNGLQAMRLALLMFILRMLVVANRFYRKIPHSPFLMPGGNMALTVELFLYVGGFRPEAGNEDVDLNNRILEVTQNGRYLKNMVVFTSVRRLKNWGLFKTIWWYIRKEANS